MIAVIVALATLFTVKALGIHSFPIVLMVTVALGLVVETVAGGLRK